MKKIVSLLLVVCLFAASLTACGKAKDSADRREVIVYFPNWKLGTPGGNVEDIPWKYVTYVNHAFWAVAPADGSSETSFERRHTELGARTDFTIVSTLPEADEIIFEGYEKYAKKYPGVRIMISIGGWSACGFFSEMAYTPEGRASFIQACIDLMDKYPWIGGIDIDWEYPSGSNDGERLPEGESDQGCPIFGTALEDRINFPVLLSEMRAAFDEHYGEGVKKLTACASSSTGWTLPNQNWKEAAKYLDYVNIMTYDMAGDWDGITGHASNVSGTKNAMAYFINNEVDKTKLNLGAPFYGTGFKIAADTGFANGTGLPIDVPSGIDKEMLTISFIRKCESEAVSGYDIVKENGVSVKGDEWDRSNGGEMKGWHMGYDTNVGGAYLYNDDPDSEFFRWYISYENELSLQGKYELLNKYDLAGMIVWECTQDTEKHEMIKNIWDGCRRTK